MSNKASYKKSDQLRKTAHRLIPGGCHTYAKGDDQYPVLSPGFISRGEGCHVWDVDGNEYIEYNMGLRAVTLGHAYGPVVEAACRQMQLGTNYTRPAPIEVECAEALLDVIGHAEQVKFAKDGSTVVSAAVKLARAYTGRNRVAICEDHPFFSYNDWFIGTTPMDAGIPEAVRALTVTFKYNDIESVREVFDRHPGEIACLLMEAARTDEPLEGFLHQVQALCRQHGGLFVLDEMITGFRWDLGGAQKAYGLEPDLSAFGKALANGFSVSALVGRREIMELGGLQHNRERVFLLSTTHGAESHALAATIKTIEIYREQSVVDRLYRQGGRLKAGVERVVRELGLQDFFGVLGRPCNLVFFTRDQDKKPSQVFRTLFMQEMIRRGVIAPSFVVSMAHSDEDIDHTVTAVWEALEIYKKALEEGAERYLIGRAVQPVYRRYNRQKSKY